MIPPTKAKFKVKDISLWFNGLTTAPSSLSFSFNKISTKALETISYLFIDLIFSFYAFTFEVIAY